MRVLLVDDEPTILATLGDAISDAGYELTRAKSGEEASSLLNGTDCLITDLRLPGMTGLELIEHSKKMMPDLKIIMITGQGSIETAVEAMKLGATEYLTKPFLNEDIVMRLQRIENELNLKNELNQLKNLTLSRCRFEDIIGNSKSMTQLFDKLTSIVDVEYDVLITGESGTGKELVARAIHNNSPRRNKPFIPISCAALPENLLEDELFGHERGAFTDAKKMRKGRFEAANGGTVMLDDIDDLPPSMQVKLLRVMQERTIERIGGNTAIPVDVRIISATKSSLLALVEDNEFREDLYYRLNVLPIEIPPLRERVTDIPLLIKHFIKMASIDAEITISDDSIRELQKYRWSGNVRELENSVKRALAFAKSNELDIANMLPINSAIKEQEADSLSLNLSLKELVRKKEKEYIKQVLKSCNGNRTEASSLLGISRKSLWEKIKGYGLE